MHILQDQDLQKFNTFGIRVKAKFFTELNSEKDIARLFSAPEFKENPKLFLGKGSNILFTSNFEGLVILNNLRGIEILEENTENVFIKAQSGEEWNDLVNFTVTKGYSGIENLTSVPGTVGAAPVQNIGAYGVELKDSLEKVEAYEIENGQKRIFSQEECQFGYRESVFKNKLKGQYFISAIVLKLNKNWNKKIEYKTLEEYIQKNNLKIQNVQKLSQVIAEIRRNRLPNPKEIGNAGSFFKNPYLLEEEFLMLKQKYPTMPFFQEEGKIKIPAGWLIENSGPEKGKSWKGYRNGQVGVYEKQALVLVNYGTASGQEILDFSEAIIKSVQEKFGISLEREVNLI